VFAEHRQRFLDRLAVLDAAALVFSGRPRLRSGDSEHRFRPDSDFVWLTGCAEPECALLLAPHGAQRGATLFLRPKDPAQERWSGPRLGVEEAPQALGIERAHPLDELWTRLPGLLAGHARLVARAGADGERDRALLACMDELRRKIKGPTRVPLELHDPALSLHELRLFKDERELDLMRRAVALSVEAHRRAMACARPGRREVELEAVLESSFRRAGATGAAYGTIVAAGANACVLHYTANADVLRENELVLVDAGAEYAWYASDVTRTFPAGGRFSPEQRALYEVVLAAQLAALERVRPGERFQAAHEAAVGVLVGGLVDLGLLRGPVDEAIRTESYQRFYMHRTGHWLGLDVHDCGAYWKNGAGRTLEPGMVTTVEPGLYVASDDDSVEPRWRGIGIRIEDDVLVTRAGCEVLSAALPKRPDEIEALVGCAEWASERA
jgi:Xaa-Pro aminopeptidase